MNYLDITKDTIVYALMQSDTGKKEIREGHFVELKYYSETDKFRRVINLAGIGDLDMNGTKIVLYPTEQDAINEQNRIYAAAQGDVRRYLNESKIDKIERIGVMQKLAVELWKWDGVKPKRTYRDFSFDVLNQRMMYDTEGVAGSYEECASVNTPTIYRFEKEDEKDYVVNVYHEYVERVSVKATNAEDAKDKAAGISTKTSADIGKLYWCEIIDAEINSVNGIPTYGEDEPSQE